MTAPTACPSCGAALRPGAPWCTLCYAAVPGPQPPAAPEPEPEPEPVPAPGEPLPAEPEPAAPAGEAAWPCTTCGADNPLARSSCAACGAGFLAAARDDAPLLVLPVVGDLGRLSRAQRLALAAGLVLAVVLLTAILGLLVG